MEALEGIGAAIDHVAIAVRSIPDALPLFVDALGGSFLFAGDQIDQGFRFAQFRLPGGGKVELVTSLAPGSFVDRFIERRGEGVHHVTFKVPDIHRAIAHLEALGVPLMNVRTDGDDWREAFIHPRDAHGTLVQVAWSRLSDDYVARHHLEKHGSADHRHILLEDLFA